MPFEINKGINISHWLSQTRGIPPKNQDWFTQKDVEKIKTLGMDFIRLPVDEEILWDTQGKRQKEAFDWMDQAIRWCQDSDLRIIVDLHILRSHHFNQEEEPQLYNDPEMMEHFAHLWKDLSDFLGHWSHDRVAYELLNEAVARDNAKWNKVYPYPYKAIRKREPERTIILGSNNYNQCITYPDLEIPQDKNLILSFHYYNPMFVTHYQASWTPFGPYKGPVNYPGQPVPSEEFRHLSGVSPEENTPFDIDKMREQIALPLKRAKEQGHKLFCGEFGCINGSPSEVQKRWYRDIRQVFEENDIAWALWDYRGAFGLLTREGREVQPEKGVLLN